jgi:anti-sigma factor RsiW
VTGEHLDDVLSAYLDDELTPVERVEVEAHLAACAECRSDLEAEAGVRRLVRELPAVDPPFGFYERILRQGPGAGQAPEKKRRLRFGLANIAGAAAAWLLILGVVNVNSAEGSVEPAPASYVNAHASVAPDLQATEDPAAAARAQATYDAPERLAGTYRLVAAIVDDDGTPQLVYTDGRRTVSMFLRPGRLNLDALPSDTERVEVNGVWAYQVPTAQGAVVFVQRSGIVVILVGADPDRAASDVAESDGPRTDEHESMLDRVADAGAGLLETFGFQG